MARTENLGDGIVRIAVPITNNPLGDTHVYAMESPNGLVLVDAGWDDENAWTGLTEGLAEIGHSVADIEGVVLTHFHPDHTGLCGRVREASGAWIAMHESDYAYFDHMVDRGENWFADERANLERAGAPASYTDLFEDSGSTPPTSRASRPDRLLTDGERIPLTGRDLVAVATPGHTVGHVCFHLPEIDVLFTGDHVLQKTTPHVGSYRYPLEDYDALDDFLSSLRKVGSMTGTRGYGAHGPHIDDVPTRAKELVAHHDERLDALAEEFGTDELTVWQVAERMTWYRPWPDLGTMHKHLALSEAGAHLRHLVARGVVAQVDGSSPARFARV